MHPNCASVSGGFHFWPLNWPHADCNQSMKAWSCYLEIRRGGGATLREKYEAESKLLFSRIVCGLGLESRVANAHGRRRGACDIRLKLGAVGPQHDFSSCRQQGLAKEHSEETQYPWCDLTIVRVKHGCGPLIFAVPRNLSSDHEGIYRWLNISEGSWANLAIVTEPRRLAGGRDMPLRPPAGFGRVHR